MQNKQSQTLQKNNVNEESYESETFLLHHQMQILAPPRSSRMLFSVKLPISKRVLLQKRKLKHLAAPLFRRKFPRRNFEAAGTK